MHLDEQLAGESSLSFMDNFCFNQFPRAIHMSLFWLQEQPEKKAKKRLFLKISQHSQENTCARASFLWGFF